jgi:ABC-type lipoprotein export system ATPase subunit
LVVTHDHRLERFAHRTVYMGDGQILSEQRHPLNPGAEA